MQQGKTQKECRIYACVNQKGGVAKTVTSANLGIGLARRGKKVLLVDLDSQTSLSRSLGIPQPDDLPVTIVSQLKKVIDDKPFEPHEGILEHGEGVDIMPSSIELAGLEVHMANVMSREFLLRSYLSEVKADYDIIVLDCPPTLGIITINALAAADRVIVPVQPEYLSVIGMTQLFETVKRVKKQINPSLQIGGVLITMANMRTNLAKNALETIREAYGENCRIFTNPVPYSTRVKEASGNGTSIFKYDPKGSAAYAYEQLVKEVELDGRQSRTNIHHSKKDEFCR
jgi:chromosome partitioning protein